MKRSLLKRLAIALVSAGWIFPLSLAFSWSSDFLWKTHLIAARLGSPDPFHPFFLAPAAFYGAMAWLFATIIAWTMYLTRNR